LSTISAANSGGIKGSAKIYKLSGSVTVNGAPAYEGQVVSEGSTIVTGAASEANIDLGLNGGLLSIKAGSSLTLEKLNITGSDSAETTLDLKEGKVHGNAKKISAASKYEIKTAKGVAGIRGTSFVIGANGSVYCSSGSIVMVFVVNGVRSAPVTVTAGQTAVPPTTAGGVPQVSNTQAPETGKVVVVPDPPKESTTTTSTPTVTVTVTSNPNQPGTSSETVAYKKD